MTPTSFVRLNLYMWLAKTGKVPPSAKGFVWAFSCHYQPKSIMVHSREGGCAEAEPQYGCYTFAFKTTVLSLVVAYWNKWLGDWAVLVFPRWHGKKIRSRLL